MTEKWQKHIDAIMNIIIDDFGYTKKEITDNSRTREAFEKKKRVSNALYKKNFTYKQIAWVMKKSHGSIYSHINPDYREKRKEKSKNYWKSY